MRRLLTYGVVGVFLWGVSAQATEPQGPVDPALRAMLKQAAYDTAGFKDPFAAWVWLADMSHRLRKQIPDDRFRVRLLEDVHDEATRAGLPPELVLSVIGVESNFDPYAVSDAGALGLMQVMPFWLKEIGRPQDNLLRMKTNLRYGCTILRYYMQKAHGNRAEALALYNGSPGSTQYVAKVYELWSRKFFPQ